jgi:hypothetical protein
LAYGKGRILRCLQGVNQLKIVEFRNFMKNKLLPSKAAVTISDFIGADNLCRQFEC